MRLPIHDDVLCAGVVVSVMCAVSLLAKTTRADRASAPQLTRAAKDFMQQSLQWLDMCNSHQDAAYKLQTVTLATAYCNAARAVATDDELARQLNIDVHQKLRTMESMQRKVLLRLQRQGHGQAQQGTRAAAASAAATDAAAVGTSINWL